VKLSNAVWGAIAGAGGGIVGGAVKLACEAIVPPRAPDREPPPGVLVADIVRRANGRELSKSEKERAAMTIHWVFSTLSGALYGFIVEAVPSTQESQGIPFGFVLWIGLHEIALPLLHATPTLGKLPIAEQINESITHCIYGFSVEKTRRSLRPLFEPWPRIA
jgi:uncharacterized membrane protein YagU involved in acid resistance